MEDVVNCSMIPAESSLIICLRLAPSVRACILSLTIMARSLVMHILTAIPLYLAGRLGPPFLNLGCVTPLDRIVENDLVEDSLNEETTKELDQAEILQRFGKMPSMPAA